MGSDLCHCNGGPKSTAAQDKFQCEAKQSAVRNKMPSTKSAAVHDESCEAQQSEADHEGVPHSDSLSPLPNQFESQTDSCPPQTSDTALQEDAAQSEPGSMATTVVPGSVLDFTNLDVTAMINTMFGADTNTVVVMQPSQTQSQLVEPASNESNQTLTHDPCQWINHAITDIEQILNGVDDNEDGEIDRDELVEAVRQIDAEITAPQVRAMYDLVNEYDMSVLPVNNNRKVDTVDSSHTEKGASNANSARFKLFRHESVLEMKRTLKRLSLTTPNSVDLSALNMEKTGESGDHELNIQTFVEFLRNKCRTVSVHSNDLRSESSVEKQQFVIRHAFAGILSTQRRTLDLFEKMPSLHLDLNGSSSQQPSETRANDCDPFVEIEEILNDVDDNEDGEIDYNEFAEGIAQIDADICDGDMKTMYDVVCGYELSDNRGSQTTATTTTTDGSSGASDHRFKLLRHESVLEMKRTLKRLSVSYPDNKDTPFDELAMDDRMSSNESTSSVGSSASPLPKKRGASEELNIQTLIAYLKHKYSEYCVSNNHNAVLTPQQMIRVCFAAILNPPGGRSEEADVESAQHQHTLVRLDSSAGWKTTEFNDAEQAMREKMSALTQQNQKIAPKRFGNSNVSPKIETVHEDEVVE